MNKEELLKSVENTYSVGTELIKKKNNDYARGNDAFSNFRNASLIGISPEQAILVRVLDKLARISNLIDKGGKNEVKDENVDDTLLDTINYLAILKAYFENEKNI